MTRENDLADWAKLIGLPVKVLWHDPERYDNSGVDPKDFDLCPCITYGVLAHVDVWKVVVQQQQQRDESDFMVFPAGCVYGCVQLEEK